MLLNGTSVSPSPPGHTFSFAEPKHCNKERVLAPAARCAFFYPLLCRKFCLTWVSPGWPGTWPRSASSRTGSWWTLGEVTGQVRRRARTHARNTAVFCSSRLRQLMKAPAGASTSSGRHVGCHRETGPGSLTDHRPVLYPVLIQQFAELIGRHVGK